MAAVAISNILYTNLHSFYPLYMGDTFNGLGTIHFSIILAIFEVSNMIVSLILGKYIGKIPRKSLIIFSYVILFLATMLFAPLSSLGAD